MSVLTIACEYAVEEEKQVDLKACCFYLVGKKENNWYDFVTTMQHKALYVFMSEENAKDFLYLSALYKEGCEVFPVSFAYIQRLLSRHNISYVMVSPPYIFL